MSESIFSKIIRREIPAHFVFEDDVCVVIMDKFPGVSGQSLVIPKKEVDYVFDLDDETYTHIFNVAKRVAKASDAALKTSRTCLLVEGFEVPHVHIKIYPIKEGATALAPFLKSDGPADDAELSKFAEQIKAAL